MLLSGPREPGLGGEIRLHAVRVGTAARSPRARVPRLQASPEITSGVAQVGAHAVVATAHLGDLLIDCVRVLFAELGQLDPTAPFVGPAG